VVEDRSPRGSATQNRHAGYGLGRGKASFNWPDMLDCR